MVIENTGAVDTSWNRYRRRVARTWRAPIPHFNYDDPDCPGVIYRGARIKTKRLP